VHYCRKNKNWSLPALSGGMNKRIGMRPLLNQKLEPVKFNRYGGDFGRLEGDRYPELKILFIHYEACHILSEGVYP